LDKKNKFVPNAKELKHFWRSKKHESAPLSHSHSPSCLCPGKDAKFVLTRTEYRACALKSLLSYPRRGKEIWI
jgi:hypothetical protein